MHEVDGELIHAEGLQLLQPLDVGRPVAEDAEPVDDLVRDEVRVLGTGPPVLGVVVALPTLDVVGEGLGQGRAVGAVATDQVGHVVADHASEPPDLFALVGDVVTYVGRCHNADGDGVGITSGLLG